MSVLFLQKDKKLADELIQEMKSNFTLTEEDEVSAYLGAQLKVDPDSRKVTMSQPFLIKKIIQQFILNHTKCMNCQH